MIGVIEIGARLEDALFWFALFGCAAVSFYALFR